MSETCTYRDPRVPGGTFCLEPATHGVLGDWDRLDVWNVYDASQPEAWPSTTRAPVPEFCLAHAGDVATARMAQWREHHKEPRRA